VSAIRTVSFVFISVHSWLVLVLGEDLGGCREASGWLAWLGQSSADFDSGQPKEKRQRTGALQKLRGSNAVFLTFHAASFKLTPALHLAYIP